MSDGGRTSQTRAPVGGHGESAGDGGGVGARVVVTGAIVVDAAVVVVVVVVVLVEVLVVVAVEFGIVGLGVALVEVVATAFVVEGTTDELTASASLSAVKTWLVESRTSSLLGVVVAMAEPESASAGASFPAPHAARTAIAASVQPGLGVAVGLRMAAT